MSHFYGTLQGNRGQATRCGTKESGLIVTAAGWEGAIRVYLQYDEKADRDRYIVDLIPWQGKGEFKNLCSGEL